MQEGTIYHVKDEICSVLHPFIYLNQTDGDPIGCIITHKPYWTDLNGQRHLNIELKREHIEDYDSFLNSCLRPTDKSYIHVEILFNKGIYEERKISTKLNRNQNPPVPFKLRPEGLVFVLQKTKKSRVVEWRDSIKEYYNDQTNLEND